MLEDFLEANGLCSKVVRGRDFSPRIECELFIKGSQPVLAVFMHGSKPLSEHIESVSGIKPLERVPDAAVEEVSGYEADFLPPLSVYGVITVVDTAVMEHGIVYCVVGDNTVLRVSTQELRDFAENPLIGKICAGN